MPDAVTHPTLHELIAFGLGKLPERAAAVVAAHLEACPACRQAVAAVPPDSFLGKVRAASPGGSSFPPSLARAGNASNSTSRPATPAIPCPNIPPELANHPKYRILRELGRGGMGVVYQARQTGMMDRQVVIKVINRALLDQPEALERFLREVHAAAQLSHPNIVTAYDAEQVGELHMLVMEFVPGQNLAEVLQKKGPLPVASACHYARQAAWALQHAHERGMVHRDIKPQNLMLTPKGQIKVLDFGLAKVVSERGTGTGITSSNSYMGTPEYSAPEQATDARTADIRADLYSLGCTLYCLLAGRPPFREDTAIKTILAHLEKQPQPLPELRPEVPERLWRVVARLLAKEPGQRYQKPLEVVQALAPFVKPGAKPDAKSGLAPALDVGSPKGTMIVADTNQIKKVLRDVPGKAPPKKVPAKEQALPFENIVDTSALPKKAKGAREARKRVSSEWYRRWALLAGVGAAVLALGVGAWLLAGIVFKTKVKTAGGEAYVVLEVDQPGAEVFVDGEKITLNIPGDNKPIEIKVEAGQHKLRISKDGFVAVTRDIELKTGRSLPIKIRLDPDPPRMGSVPPKLPGEDSGKPTEGAGEFAPKVSEEQTVAKIKRVSGIEMVRIPAGEFFMGSEDGAPDEKPRHKVRISKPFWIGKYEVTVGQFKRFVDATGYRTDAEKTGDRGTWKKPGFAGDGFVQTNAHPVVWLSWNDANVFCLWLAREAGANVRLPREAEWEYACRAGTTTNYYFGDDVADLGDNAWYGDNNKPNGTKPCGQKKPNVFGLYDMHGNAWEWCQAWYGGYTNGDKADINEPKTGDRRVLRGGSFNNNGWRCRAAHRVGWGPDGHYFGFRVVFCLE